MSGRIAKRVVGKFKTLEDVVTGRNVPGSVGCTVYILEDGESATVFNLKKIHEGHHNLAHGGVTAAILDEVMG